MRDLQDQLAAEADQARPAFDAGLHARTMQRIDAARRGQAESSVRAPRPRSPWPAAAVGVVGATIALLVALPAFRSPLPPGLAHGPQVQPLMDVLAGAGTPFKEAVADPFTEARSNTLLQLRDDGTRLVEFVFDQVTMRSVSAEIAPSKPTPVPPNPS